MAPTEKKDALTEEQRAQIMAELMRLIRSKNELVAIRAVGSLLRMDRQNQDAGY